MSVYFVTRHAGAKAWAESEGLKIDACIEHLEMDQITAGDTILGTLPINLVAELNAKGIRYFHLILPLPVELRGQEITKEIMKKLGAKMQEYKVTEIGLEPRL
jgi:CRISPR-associated protein Csx16